MSDPFRRLPAPILLMTMKLIPTLPSLYNLTRASSAAAEMFEELAAEIVGAVTGPLPAELQLTIRAVTLTLSANCADPDSGLEGSTPSIESALELLTTETTIKDPIRRDLPLSCVKILVDCACQIYKLAAAFLECHIKRLNAVQPQHLHDPRHRFTRGSIIENYPKGRAYTPSVTGAPSWVEEYRVVRALWLLQLYRILEVKCESPKSKTSRVGDKKYRFSEAWEPRLKMWELDNMECVQDWLSEMHISLYSGKEDMYLSSLQVSLAEADKRSILEHAPTDKLSVIWCQDFDASQNRSMGFQFFHIFGKRSPKSVLKNCLWGTFRRLGFGIWDLKRMAVMELLDVPKEVLEPDGTRYRTGVGVQLNFGNICFTWKSIEDQKIS